MLIMRNIILFVSILFLISTKANAISSVTSFIGCLGKNIEEPKSKSFNFSATLVVEDKHGMRDYEATGTCTFEKQVCDGGTLFNRWSARSDEFKVVTHNARRWIIKLDQGWELNYDFPQCNNIATLKSDDHNYRIWLIKRPDLPPHKQKSIWRSKLIAEESLDLNGMRIMDVTIDIKYN